MLPPASLLVKGARTFEPLDADKAEQVADEVVAYAEKFDCDLDESLYDFVFDDGREQAGLTRRERWQVLRVIVQRNIGVEGYRKRARRVTGYAEGADDQHPTFERDELFAWSGPRLTEIGSAQIEAEALSDTSLVSFYCESPRY